MGGDDKSSTLTKKGRIDDLDFYIGDEAIQQKTYRYASLANPAVWVLATRKATS